MKPTHNLCPCGQALEGTRRKFCSTECVIKSSNSKHQNYSNQQRRGASRKIKLMQMKGMSCQVCGYNKNYSALAFHHKDPKQKSFALDMRTCSNKSWESLLEEAAKCDLVCMNCHMEIHHPDLDAESSHLLEPMKCKLCGEAYQPCKSKRQYCSEHCYRIKRRKVERPSREQLEKDLSEMSCLKVGKKYGVSDNSIRKWLKNKSN